MATRAGILIVLVLSRCLRAGRPRWALEFVVLLAAGTATGCGYLVGSAYPPEIQTVHVPIFTSESFRRGFEYQLTEAVHKQIQQRTPFRLADEQHADTRLIGRIIDVRKDVLGETAFDDPRELQLALVVEVTWEDIRSRRILAQQRIPVAPEAVVLESRAEFAPEVGHSLATGTHEAVEHMARQVVNMMESPW